MGLVRRPPQALLLKPMERYAMGNPNDMPPAAGEREIRRLVETAEEGGQRDEYTGKRAAKRFAVGMQLDVTTDATEPDCTWPVIMHNVSGGGFAFWSKRQLRTGCEIHVREFTGDDPMPWLPACVTHCTVGIKGYLVGAQFEADPETQ